VAVLSSAIFDNDAWVTVAEIAATLTYSVHRVACIMRQLETKGVVERHDTGESTRWNPRLWHRIRTIEEVDWKVHGR
jgi:predicted transcriptional regulator